MMNGFNLQKHGMRWRFPSVHLPMHRKKISIGVIGAGAWGTAIAKVLAENGHTVMLWAREEEVVHSVNNQHTNTLFLPGVTLPQELSCTSNLSEAANKKDMLFLAVPSPYLLSLVKDLFTVPDIRDGNTLIAILTKGFIESPRGVKLIVESLEDYLPGFYRGNLVYVSGPSHAEEVSRKKVTGLIAASVNGRNAIKVREALANKYLFVYPSLDVVGVQVCGAVKNVVAIAFGMLDALKENSDHFGDNTESLLLAAGLNEIQMLGQVLGATHPETFTSIAGVGDLDVTCRSIHGRNRRFGREIIQKHILDDFTNLEDLLKNIHKLGYLPEGAVAAQFVYKIAKKHKIKLPICYGVYKILNQDIKPEDFIENYITDLTKPQ